MTCSARRMTPELGAQARDAAAQRSDPFQLGKVAVTSKVVGTRLLRLRLLEGASQEELASDLNLPQSQISRIERRVQEPSADVLDRYSKRFGCTVGFLTAPTDVLTTRPWLRAYADAPKRTVDQQVADVEMATEVICDLDLRLLPDKLPAAQRDFSDPEEIEQLAVDTRVIAGLDETGACDSVIRRAERLGCVVIPMAGELGRHLGMSVRSNGIPVICAARHSESTLSPLPGDRQRFTVAHELGHLVLHSAMGPPSNSEEATVVERQAHRFAGAFLAPGDALVESLEERGGGRVTLSTLAVLKGDWGMSIKALVMRFRALGVINEAKARSLHKQISARGWTKQEPGYVEPEYAVWFRQAVERSTGLVGQAAIGAAAERAGVDVRHLARWTDWSSHGDVKVPVLPRSRRPPATTRTGSGGTVVDLGSRRR
jgi:Zn-dependent peptidase ImmA (M78 family)/transcriptional regulator with XRE-family HTH domain